MHVKPCISHGLRSPLISPCDPAFPFPVRDPGWGTQLCCLWSGSKLVLPSMIWGGGGSVPSPFVSSALAFINLTWEGSALCGLQREHGNIFLFSSLNQSKWGATKAGWMCLVFLHVLYCPVWQRVNIPFAVSEWGHWVLRQSDTGFPKGEGAGCCWELCQGLFPPLRTQVGSRQERGWRQAAGRGAGVVFARAGTMPQGQPEPMV